MSAAGPVLLAFFKVSCPTCQFTFPFLERLASSSSLTILGISQDDAAATKRFQDKYQLTFPILIDEKQSYIASNAYRITNVPSLFLVEAGGRVTLSSAGFSRIDLEQLTSRFDGQMFRPGEKIPDFKPG